MKNREKNFVSAVVYVRNNEKTIKDFLENINALFSENFEKYEIICVNDASEDNSVAKVKEAAALMEKVNVSIVSMSFYQGIEAAMLAGIDIAIGDFVYEFDNAYIDFDLDMIMQIYYKSLEGFDIVSAAADRKQKFSSELFYSIFNKYTNYQYELRTESFRVLSRRAINRASSLNKTMPYRKAVYANCGLKYTTLTYAGLPVSNGEAVHMDKKEKIRRRNLAVDSLILFTDVAYRFSTGMTILMMCITVLMAAYTVFIFVTGNPTAGWTTTLAFLSLAFFGLFGILTVVIKYLSILVNLVFKKQKYTFESIEKLTK